MQTRSLIRRQFVALPAVAVIAAGIGVATSAPATAATPDCAISPYHEVGDGLSDATFATYGYTPFIRVNDGNFQSVTVPTIWTNQSTHTFYNAREVVVDMLLNFDGGIGVSGQHPSTYVEVNGESTWVAPVPDGTPAGSLPADPTVEGYEFKLAAGSPHMLATELGIRMSGDGLLGPVTVGTDEVRPYFTLASDEIAPGAASAVQVPFYIERHVSASPGFYWVEALVAQTCLPEPTIDPWATDATDPLAAITGTGTTPGSTVVLTREDGTVIGTTVIGEDLTWSITPTEPVGEELTTLSAVETDEFGFDGTTEQEFLLVVPTEPTTEPAEPTTGPTEPAEPTTGPTDAVIVADDDVDPPTAPIADHTVETLPATGATATGLAALALSLIGGGTLLLMAHRRVDNA